MSFVQISIYDLVGYFIPGTFALVGIYFAICPLLIPLEHFWHVITPLKIASLGLMAYVAGHCIQGLANYLMKWSCFSNSTSPLSPAISVMAKQRMAQLMNFEDNVVTDKQMEDFADHYVLQIGKTETRDIYVYREGFYRGLWVAMTGIAFATLVRLFCSCLYFVFGNRLPLSNDVLIVILLLSIIGLLICYQRFRRFEEYRRKYAIQSFLVLTSNVAAKDTKNA